MNEQIKKILANAKKSTRKINGQIQTRWTLRGEYYRVLPDEGGATPGNGWVPGNLSLEAYAAKLFYRASPLKLKRLVGGLSMHWGSRRNISKREMWRALGVSAAALRDLLKRKRKICALRARRDAELEAARWIPGGGESTLERLAQRVRVEVGTNIPVCLESMGGQTWISVRSGSREATAIYKDTRATYAKSCAWRENHGELEIELSVAEARQLHVVGGLWTVCAASRRQIESGKRVWACKWLELKREGRSKHLRQTWVAGYICGGFHAPTPAEAARGYRRRAAAERLRQLPVGARALEQCRVARDEVARILATVAGQEIVVTRADSAAAGNCGAGTAAFGKRYGIGESCRLRTLLAAALLDARAGRATWRNAILCAWQAVRAGRREI